MVSEAINLVNTFMYRVRMTRSQFIWKHVFYMPCSPVWNTFVITI